MGNPVPGGVVKVPLTRHHVGHCARLQGRQFFLVVYLDTLDDLSLGKSSQYQFSPLVSEGQDGSGGRRIEGERTAHPGIPTSGVVEWGHPRSFDDTHETVIEIECGFVAIPPEVQ